MKKIIVMMSLLLLFVVSCGSSKEFSIDVDGKGKVPNFELKDLNGKTIDSGKILNNGKKTLFIVAAEWCPHCKAEAPYVQEFYDKYKDKINVMVIYSNVNTNLENSVKFVKDNGYTYPTYYDENGTILRAFGIEVFPFNLRIDDGKVTKVLELPVNLEKLETEFIK